MTRVLVVCGGGTSSGFLAQKMRRAAAQEGIEVAVEARSDTDIDEYIGRIDVLLLGPHLAYLEEKVRAQVEPHGIKVVLLPQRIYGRLDGNAAIQLAVEAIAKGDDQ